jgi:hypothetical protein
MSDIGKVPIEPDDDLDDELVRFTDDLLDGRIELDEAENNLSENEELRDLQEMVLRMQRAFGSEDPNPAMASRMKMSLVTELRKMDFQDEAKPDSLLERIRKLLTGGRNGRGFNVLIPVVGLAAVFLFVFVFLLSDFDFNDLLGSSLNNPNGYPIPGQMEAVTLLFGETERVSVSSNGGEVDQDSWYSAISGDGRFTAFVSASDDLVNGDGNGMRDIFVHDQNSGQTERISLSTAGVEGNGDSINPAISADGRFVAFESQANNLVGGDGNGARDIFVRDRLLGTTELISVVNGQSAFGDSRHPAVSDDGRYVTFYSYAPDLAQNDDNGVGDVFLFDRQSGTMSAVSLTPGGQVGDRESRNPAISGDGQVVAFESLATDLVTNDNNNASDIFIYSQQSGQLTRVSVNGEGEEGDSHSFNPDLSMDGGFVAFQSQAENLWVNDSNGKADIFVYHRDGSNQVQVERVSVASEGGQSNGDSGYASISADGRFVTFSSFANNLAGGEIYGNNLDIYIYDRQLNETERISADPLGQEPDGASVNPDISADGRFVSFDSTGTNLVADDNNDRVDVFVRDRMPPVAVELNYLTGSPGSYFTLSGSNFQPESDISLVVNGFALGNVMSDGDGRFTAVLATDGADLGGYIVQASAGTLSGAVGFVLDENSAVRPLEGQAAVFNVPPGIAYIYFNHLPTTIGN